MKKALDKKHPLYKKINLFEKKAQDRYKDIENRKKERKNALKKPKPVKVRGKGKLAP